MARPRLVCLALALITLVIYLPVTRHAFILYDDPEYLTENPVVQNGLTLDGLKWAFTTFHANNWHPLTWISHMTDVTLFGMDSGAHHLVNVLFHAANTVIVFLLLARMSGRVWPSALVAALFAWHPLHVQSVAWAAERKDVLSTLLGLLTIASYLNWVQAASATRAPGKAADQATDKNPV
jgi:protein O-mannosyl-transferase